MFSNVVAPLLLFYKPKSYYECFLNNDLIIYYKYSNSFPVFSVKWCHQNGQQDNVQRSYFKRTINRLGSPEKRGLKNGNFIWKNHSRAIVIHIWRVYNRLRRVVFHALTPVFIPRTFTPLLSPVPVLLSSPRPIWLMIDWTRLIHPPPMSFINRQKRIS